MRKTAILILLFLINSFVFAQNEIKKMIYDDLLLINQYFNQCLIQHQQIINIIYPDDTVKINETITDLAKHPEDVVSIISIDTSNNPWIFVKVKFLLSGGYDFIYLFENTFDYVLIQEKIEPSKYYRVNGFFISEYLIIPDNYINENSLFNYKRIKRLENKNKYNKIEKMFKISVIETLGKEEKRQKFKGEPLKTYKAYRHWYKKIKQTPILYRNICNYPNWGVF